MNCREAMDLYCALDRGEVYPEGLKEHIRSCLSCQRIIDEMESTLRAHREGANRTASPALERRVLGSLENLDPHPSTIPETMLSPGSWVLPGILLILGIVGVPFSTVFALFDSFPGRSLEIMVPLVLGAAFTAYAAFFAGYNLEWLKKKFLS